MDLQTRTVTDETYTGSWQTLGTHYYRYYTTESSIGFVHGLKYVVGPEAYAGLGGNPDAAPVAGVADKYYEYDPDTRRVTKAATHGGTIEFTFDYEEAPHGDTGYNVWQLKAEMTLPDGATKTVFSNHAGRDLLVDHNSSSGRWIHYNKYNTQGHLEWRVEPSAIDMTGTPYNDGVADLAVDFNQHTGLIHVTTYYTSTGSGAAEGYPEFQQVQQGKLGTPISISKTEYISHSMGSGGTLSTIYPVWKRTVYKSDASNGSDPVVTEYDYTWHSGTNQPATITTNLPDIGSGQNGGAWLTDQTRVQTFDILGRLVSSTDARGTVTTYDYDDATDTLLQMVQDPGSGHLNIITDYESDDMGRTIKTMGPEFTSGGSTKRTVNWTVYLDHEHEIRTGQGYKYGSNSYALVNPISITKTDPSGRVTDEIQATTSSTSSVPTGSISQSDWTRWTHHEYDEDGFLTHTDVYYLIPSSGAGTEGTNFNRTRFGYDVMGRRNMVKSPAGTITRTVYDPRGLVLSVWVGTSDTGATDTNPAGSGGNNMKPVTINTYDEDAYGTGVDSLDGLLTKVTSPVDDNWADDRVVKYRYDWRDRQVKMITTDGTNTFEAENEFDNLSRVTNAKETRLGSPNRLIAESETLYDDWGRVYRTLQKGINDSGSVTQTLTSNTWYDAENNVIKSFPAGSEAFTKNTYDAIGRQTASYTGYYSGSGIETPQSVATDVVFEQTHTAYDKASNVIHTTTKERWHDATGNGALNGPSGSQPKSRDSYLAVLYDGIGRNIATANYGTNNDAGPPTWPTTVPSSTANVLVTHTTYNEKGEVEYVTDPAGTITQTIYDAAGRVTSTTRNYSVYPDEVITMTYNPESQLATLTAVNSDTGNQVTTYSYGVTLTGSGIASNALLASVDYPDGGDVDYEYNRQGQRIKLTDQNGSVHQYEYDKLGRQTADKVTFVANGVDDSVRMITWSYDNRKRLEKVTSWDAVTSGDETSEVEFAYNSFNQLVTEWQQHGGAVNTGTSPKVQYSYASGSANTIRRENCTYPNGKVLAYEYATGTPSKLSRVSSLTWDSTSVATYDYLGLGQVVIQKYPEPSNDVEYTLAGGSSPNPYTGLDRFGRIIDLVWKQPSTTLVQLKYGYDLASNRTYRRDEVARSHSEKFDELYFYDGLHRLNVFARGELNSGNNGFTSSATLAQAWTLDATGNWKGFDQLVDNPFTTTRTHNTVNEITGITTVSGSPTWDTPPAYDNNGNMTQMPSPLDVADTLEGVYDPWNRLVETDDATTVVVYAYDGLNRRITKASGGTVRHYYYSDQWQVLEERLDSDTTADRQYVWGLRYIDDMVLRDSTSERLYALQDALFNVVAVTDDTGDVVERFAYQPYGQSEELDPDYTVYLGTNYGWNYRFTGRELDLETGLQINRNRYLHLQLGRWLMKDPIGYAGSRWNLYAYVLSKSIDSVDPTGLFRICVTFNDGRQDFTEELECGDYGRQGVCGRNPITVSYWPMTGSDQRKAEACARRRGTGFFTSWDIVSVVVGPCTSDHYYVKESPFMIAGCLEVGHVDLASEQQGDIRIGLYGPADAGGLPKPRPMQEGDCPITRSSSTWRHLEWGTQAGKPCRYATDADIRSCIVSKPAPISLPQLISGDKTASGDCFNNCRTDIAETVGECCLVGWPTGLTPYK